MSETEMNAEASAAGREASECGELLAASSNKREILNIVHKYGAMEPEEGESWESWYAASFDLMASEIGECLGR